MELGIIFCIGDESDFERDVEEMTVIPTSYNCPLLPSQPFALRAHTALESTTASSPFPAAFTVSRDLIPLLGARTVLPLLETDRGVGEAGGGAREPSFLPATKAV